MEYPCPEVHLLPKWRKRCGYWCNGCWSGTSDHIVTNAAVHPYSGRDSGSTLGGKNLDWMMYWLMYCNTDPVLCSEPSWHKAWTENLDIGQPEFDSTYCYFRGWVTTSNGFPDLNDPCLLFLFVNLWYLYKPCSKCRWWFCRTDWLQTCLPAKSIHLGTWRKSPARQPLRSPMSQTKVYDHSAGCRCSFFRWTPWMVFAPLATISKWHF